MGEAIRLIPERGPGSAANDRGADDATLRGRVQRIISVFAAIEAGELLAVLPDSPADRTNHLAAVDLLAMAEAEALQLAADLDLRDAG
jgi:hypothetical protein